MITNNESTICAISTPAGVGGIAVARVSGADAFVILSKIWKGCDLETAQSHTAHLGDIVDPEQPDVRLDQAVVTLFRAPHSFTGENVAEISIHGSTWIQRELIRLLIDAGCQMAEPGEFSRRAFASGRMDLAETEAVADLIASTSRAAHRIAMNQMKGAFSKRLKTLRESLLDLCALLELELDFSEEDVEFASRTKLLSLSQEIKNSLENLAGSFADGSAIKDGIPVAIVGHTNAGKSTLLNTLLGENRAIVSDIHGTTRDTIEDTINIKGALFRITDTAGLRNTSDPIESIGIERSIKKAKGSRVIVWVIDPSESIESLSGTADIIISASKSGDNIPIIAAVNKSDLNLQTNHEISLLSDILPPGGKICNISARDGKGIPELLETIHQISGASKAMTDDVLVSNARHYQALTAAIQSIERVIDGLNQNLSGDFIAQDLRETIHHIGTITGAITTPDILQTVFSRFCIGK